MDATEDDGGQGVPAPADHEEVGDNAEDTEGTEDLQPPPPPLETTNLNQHLVGEGWLLKKSRKKKGKFQQRYFRVDGEALSHYANNAVNKTVRGTYCDIFLFFFLSSMTDVRHFFFVAVVEQSKEPLMLADLRNVRIPSLDPEAGGRGIDLHFLSRTVTLLPVEDNTHSEKFLNLLRTAKIPASISEHLDTERGAKLLLVKCDSCGNMQGVRADDVLPSCSVCGEPLDVSRGKEAESKVAAEKKHVECGVCGQCPFEYACAVLSGCASILVFF